MLSNHNQSCIINLLIFYNKYLKSCKNDYLWLKDNIKLIYLVSVWQKKLKIKKFNILRKQKIKLT